MLSPCSVGFWLQWSSLRRFAVPPTTWALERLSYAVTMARTSAEMGSCSGSLPKVSVRSRECRRAYFCCVVCVTERSACSCRFCKFRQVSSFGGERALIELSWCPECLRRSILQHLRFLELGASLSGCAVACSWCRECWILSLSWT